MHDGTLRFLSYVLYDLDMKKKLTFLRILVGKSLRITCADSGLKAFKGVLVVMKGIWKKNLFFLQGSIVIGRVVITLICH